MEAGNCPGGPEKRLSKGSSIVTSPGSIETMRMAYSRTKSSAVAKASISTRVNRSCTSAMAAPSSSGRSLARRRILPQDDRERFRDVLDRLAALLDTGENQRAFERRNRQRRQPPRLRSRKSVTLQRPRDYGPPIDKGLAAGQRNARRLWRGLQQRGRDRAAVAKTGFRHPADQ